MRELAARANQRAWLLWRPFWHWTPLVLACRFQLAIVLLAFIQVFVHLNPQIAGELDVISTSLVVYGAYTQIRRSYRRKRFNPWEPG